MTPKPSIFYHVAAFITAAVWGTTFVSSKVLLNAGLSPAEILMMRFIIAYIALLPICHKHILTRSWQDELLFAILGISGGSVYFLAENTALQLTENTSTVAMLVCTTPIITAFCTKLVWRDTCLSRTFLAGSLVALVGVALVIFNGVFVLDDNPLVIALSVGASFLWAVYSIALRKLGKKYNSLVITRKVFFWGIVTMLPYFAFHPFNSNYALLAQPAVYGNVIYLALIASLCCYLIWNIVIHHLGVVTAGNYLYFNPVISLITAAVVLSENITHLAVIGCFLTILGVYLANKKASANA